MDAWKLSVSQNVTLKLVIAQVASTPIHQVLWERLMRCISSQDMTNGESLFRVTVVTKS